MPFDLAGGVIGGADNTLVLSELLGAGATEVVFSAGEYFFDRVPSTTTVSIDKPVTFSGAGDGVTILKENQTWLEYGGAMFGISQPVCVKFNNLTIAGPEIEPTTGDLAPVLYAIRMQDSTSTFQVVELNNVSFSGWFTHNIWKDQGAEPENHLLVKLRNVVAQAYHSSIALFATDGINATLDIDGFTLVRAGVPLGHPGYPFDHGMYIHPHINLEIKNSIFNEWGGYFAIHHFSAGGKTSQYASLARYTDTIFNGIGQTFEVSNQMPTDFVRCEFNNSGAYSKIKNLKVRFTECIIKSLPLSNVTGYEVDLEFTGGNISTYIGNPWVFVGGAVSFDSVEFTGISNSNVFLKLQHGETLTVVNSNFIGCTGPEVMESWFSFDGQFSGSATISGNTFSGQTGKYFYSAIIETWNDVVPSATVLFANNNTSGYTGQSVYKSPIGADIVTIQ